MSDAGIDRATDWHLARFTGRTRLESLIYVLTRAWRRYRS